MGTLSTPWGLPSVTSHKATVPSDRELESSCWSARDTGFGFERYADLIDLAEPVSFSKGECCILCPSGLLLLTVLTLAFST